MDRKAQRSELEGAIGALAEGQHGVVTRAQLLELGLGPAAVDSRVRMNRLRPVHRGVYTIGHRLLTRHGRWMAAVLACGPDAVLSHHAAAALWGIRQSGRVEVTTPGARHRRDGIRLHRATLPQDERTTHRGIPTTTVARTLLDLSAVVSRDDLRSALRHAEQLRLTDRTPLSELARRYQRRPGLSSVHAVLDEAQRGLGIVRSELEERFQAFLLNAGLPMPRTNAQIEGHEVDCVWEDGRIIVELDGHAAHSGPHAFEGDRRRDRRLEAMGWHVIRITWRQLHDEPEAVEADLRRLTFRPA
jgi:very-short-patch-repair endonuclease